MGGHNVESFIPYIARPANVAEHFIHVVHDGLSIFLCNEES